MKTDFNYLPEIKQKEILKIVSIINKITPTEIIILFGSYARNEWVEEKYNEEHYRYQSDFDILLIVETKSESSQTKFEREVEETIEQDENIKTPVSVIVHDIDFVNRRLLKAQYFFTDIKKEGVILYNSEKFTLKEPKELSKKERYYLAKQDFDYWFNSVEQFFDQFYFSFENKHFSIAAFLLHQITERLYSGILLVFTRYKPNTHDLSVLRKLANSVDARLIMAFHLDNPESRRLFKLLRKAYIDARYKPNYIITSDELLQLSNQIRELKEIGNLICSEKISNLLC